MGRTDITLKECLQNNQRYADCFNAAAGYQIIQPDQLQTLEQVVEGSVTFKKTIAHYKKERDGARKVCNYKGILCAIACLENQEDIDYAEAVRHMIYDAYSYNRQLIDIWKKHEQEEASTGKQWKKFRGFDPSDRLIPVVTVCLYYGKEPWDAPLDLIDLIDFSGFEEQEQMIWRSLVQNYRIHVLDIRRMEEAVIEGMSSDMKHLFGLLKRTEDKQKMKDYLHTHDTEIRNMQPDLFQAFISIAGVSDLKKYMKVEKEGEIDMCKAIYDMVEDGRKEGIKEGIQEGRKEGIQEGRKEGRLGMIKELLEEHLLSLQDAARKLNLTEEELKRQLSI